MIVTVAYDMEPVAGRHLAGELARQRALAGRDVLFAWSDTGTGAWHLRDEKMAARECLVGVDLAGALALRAPQYDDVVICADHLDSPGAHLAMACSAIAVIAVPGCEPVAREQAEIRRCSERAHAANPAQRVVIAMYGAHATANATGAAAGYADRVCHVGEASLYRAVFY